MAAQERYQRGSLEKVQTDDGPCWYLRFRRREGESGPPRPRYRIGLVKHFPTKTAAHKASEDLRKDFNARKLIQAPVRMFQEVIDRYSREEMPERFSTAKGYRNLLQNHIAPRWGRVPLEDVKASAVRDWIRSMDNASKTKGHVRGMMRTLFSFAMLWEWLPRGENPMSLFRLEGVTRRSKRPRVLTQAEVLRLVDEIGREPYRTMVLLAACLGLRCSEIFGLQWRDLDWDKSTITVSRAVIQGRVGKVKTEQSGRPLPLHPAVAALLQAYRKHTEFLEPFDWIFASPFTGGEKTYHAERVQQYVIRKAAKTANMGEGIGWHTLRHSYRAWLDREGAPLGVQRDLLRHANITTTMDVYGGSFVDSLREANEAVVKGLIQ